MLDGAQLQGALLRNTQRMWVHQPYAKAPARRAQPALVFRKIVAPVQPGHAPGVAFVEGRGECLFAGLVTTALTRKDRDRRDPARKKIPGGVVRSETLPEPFEMTQPAGLRSPRVLVYGTASRRLYCSSWRVARLRGARNI